MIWIRYTITILAIVRLLAPPGICMCHADSPVLLIMLSLSDPSREHLPSQEINDDHHPGCPCSPLSVGLGLAPCPVDVPHPVDETLDDRVVLETTLGKGFLSVPRLAPIQDPPLQSGLTPLLI